jgi:hypothetical protein
MSIWEDMSSAPRDGTEILISDSDGFMYIAVFINGNFVEDFHREYVLNSSTNKWQPLPPPPGGAE